jgi:transposase
MIRDQRRRGVLGHKERNQLELFITGSLRQLIPDDHVLVRVDRVLDLSWLRGEVSDCYCCDDGRPGIDPEVTVRLMLAGLLTGIVHDRKLMREAHVNIAIRWFAGYALHEKLPDHSSLTRIRQRWGEERFRKIFKRTVEACLKAKIATAEVVHIDASLIRANVSWDSLVERHVEDVLSENESEEEMEVKKKGRQSGKYKKVCTTDPDATMATNARNRRLEPAYKQHTAVDDKVGVILDVAVTTGQTNEGEMIEPQVDEIEATTGVDIKTVTADAGYTYAKVYGALERRGICCAQYEVVDPNNLEGCGHGKLLFSPQPILLPRTRKIALKNRGRKIGVLLCALSRNLPADAQHSFRGPAMLTY